MRKTQSSFFYNKCYIVFIWENWTLTDFLCPKETFLPRRLGASGLRGYFWERGESGKRVRRRGREGDRRGVRQ